jgi:hypothetical protein
VLRASHAAAVQLGAVPLRRELELLAQRGRVQLEAPANPPRAPKANRKFRNALEPEAQSIRWSTDIALQRRTGNNSTSLRPVASSMKSTGGVILANSPTACSRPADGTSGGTPRALQIQQVDGGFQDADADRLLHGQHGKPEVVHHDRPKLPDRGDCLLCPVTANGSISCAGV